MTQNEEFNKIAEIIIDEVNKTDNDYDAREQVLKVISQNFGKEEVPITIEEILWEKWEK